MAAWIQQHKRHKMSQKPYTADRILAVASPQGEARYEGVQVQGLRQNVLWAWLPPPPPHQSMDSEGASGCTWSTARATAPSPGRPTPGVVKQDKSSGGSVDTTKTRSGPQRVRMSGGERPIGAAKGNQRNTEALCHPPPPLLLFLPKDKFSLGHFWYTSFWVPDPPPHPHSTTTPSGTGLCRWAAVNIPPPPAGLGDPRRPCPPPALQPAALAMALCDRGLARRPSVTFQPLPTPPQPPSLHAALPTPPLSPSGLAGAAEGGGACKEGQGVDGLPAKRRRSNVYGPPPFRLVHAAARSPVSDTLGTASVSAFPTRTTWGCKVHSDSLGGLGGGPQGCIGKGGGNPPPLQGAQPMPSHCLPDAKCRPQRHL